ncbi:MAG TPA: YciI family protein [Terriglobales bacterium]|nr:YciI family protein [Terriglobales bacterium]
MRVMVLVKACEQSEAGILPSPELLAEMGGFNNELIKAGVMLAGEGLKSSANGVRVKFGDKKSVIEGPFAEAKELVAGFWLWKVPSLEEAIAWLKRAPFGGDAEVEIRPLFEPEDFGCGVEHERQQRQELSKASA